MAVIVMFIKKLVCLFLGCVDSNPEKVGTHETICKRCGETVFLGGPDY
jgi:hypothetical protein